MNRFARVATCCLLLIPLSCLGQASESESTEPEVRFKIEGQHPPQASLRAVDWFVGAWQGEVFGGAVEHIVLPERAGQVPGLVRLWNDSSLSAYELSSFLPVEGSLTYRNRHFGADLVAWQDRADYVDRPLVAIEGETLYFDGITFAPDGADKAVVAFVLTAEDGSRQKHVVRYKRQP
jgi:hypothetical protein